MNIQTQKNEVTEQEIQRQKEINKKQEENVKLKRELTHTHTQSYTK